MNVYIYNVYTYMYVYVYTYKEIYMGINFEKPFYQCVFSRSCGRNYVLEQSNNYCACSLEV